MAIAYPLNMPTTIGIENITLRAVNAVTDSESPFTYQQQTFAHAGQKWEADISIPSGRRDLCAEWVAMLVSLKGQTGSFLLGDPDYATPRGDVSSCTVSGSIGDETVSVTMTGTLKAGDYIQLGTGASARLHKVMQDQTGTGSLEIWPGLRSAYSNETAIFNEAKGVFKLKNNISEWSISSANTYGISFECKEKIT